MSETEARNRQIYAQIVNMDDLVTMFGNFKRLMNSDFSRKWHAFPTTRNEMQATLAEIGVDGIHHTAFQINNYDAVINELNDRLPRITTPATLDELNYLAVKMAALTQDEHNVFRAVVESGRHCESIKGIINITENLDLFDLQPAHTIEQYGEFLLDMYRNDSSNVFERLKTSMDLEDTLLARYIERLEASVDPITFAHGIVKEENGVFTQQGYLTELGGFREVYCGHEDIPDEYRVFAFSEPEVKEKSSIMDMSAANRDDPDTLHHCWHL